MTTARYWLPENATQEQTLRERIQSASNYRRPEAPQKMATVSFPVDAIRRDFPILHREVNGKPLIWLDNAATTQKPTGVIETLVEYYSTYNSNVHRGAHALAREATEALEGSRAKVAGFLGAARPEEVVFVRGATEGINLVASSWGGANVQTGDEIILSTLEHHANIVPWQQLAKDKRAKLRVIPIDDTGAIDLEKYEQMLNQRTALVAISHASNVLGTIVPVREMITIAHRYGARVLVDGAQAVGHFPVDVQALDADFYVLSGHKLFAPTGIGALFAKQEVLDGMPPWQTGGNMIEKVEFGKSTFAQQPHRMEAGTLNIAGAIGLGAAVDYLNGLDRNMAEAHENHLAQYASQALARIPGLRQFGATPDKIAVHSFLIDGTDPMAVASFLDQQGIAVRAGHHCAQPTLARFGETSTIRPSLSFYNTMEEVDALVQALHAYLESPEQQMEEPKR